MSALPVNNVIQTINNNKETSLILLKVNALIADFIVPRRKVQKFINKNEVRPINSQPKKRIIALSAITNKDILIMNQFSKIINRSA
jgi:hypothetical protein